MPAIAMERPLSPITPGIRRSGSRVPMRAALYLLPLLIAFALMAVFAGAGAAGACSGAGITLADLPDTSAALREALG